MWPIPENRVIIVVNIAIVSDFPVVRDGLRAHLERAGAVVTAQARADPEDTKQLTRQPCDAVFLDLTALERALTVCRAMAGSSDLPPITGVDCFGRAFGDLHRLMSAGMRGYVSMMRNGAGLERAVAAAERSETVVIQETPSREIGAAAALVGVETRPRTTELDGQILQLAGEGSKDREIAEELGFSESYIRHRLEALEHQFGAGTRFHLGCWAVWYGLVEPRQRQNSSR